MKYYFVLLLAMYAMTDISAQILADKWSITYSNPNGPGSLEFVESITDSNGNVYVLTTAFTGSDHDAILIKFGAEGTVEWDVEYSSAYGSSEDYGVDLVFDASENVYVLVNVNPDDATNSSSPNGYVIYKYNSSGTEVVSYEDVNDATVKLGPIAYDIGFKGTQIFVTSSRVSSGNGLQARLKRLSTSLAVSATATYDTTNDDIAGQVYLPDDGSSELFWLISQGTNVIWRYYSVNFASGSSTSIDDVVYNIGSDVASVIKAVSSTNIYGELTDGRFFISTVGSNKVLFSSLYTINDIYKDGSIVYVTGSKTIAGHEELLFSGYAGSTMQFEYYLDETHGSLSSTGMSIYDNGEITIGGNLVSDGENYPGTVTFDSDGQITASPYLGVSASNIVESTPGGGSDNVLIGNASSSVTLYAQCVPPTIDLGEDFTPTEGSIVTLGEELPSGMTYTWSTGVTTKTIDVTEDGTYSVTVTNTNGCSTSDDITVDFLLPAPAAPTMLQPIIDQAGSPYADIGIHWSNDDPLATSHVVSQSYPDLGSEFSSEFSTTSNSKVINHSSGTFSRFSVASKNDDDVVGGSTPFFSLNGCNEYTMQELEAYLSGLSVAGIESVAEGSDLTYSLTGFTPGDDELNSFFEWTFPDGWEVTEYSPIMVKVAVAESASSGEVSVVIRNVCTGESTQAITKTIYAIKDQTIDFDQPSDIQLGSEAISLGATASSGLEVSYSLSNDNAELAGSFLIAKHAGEVIVTASQAGNGEYNAAENVERTITILKGDDEITFESLGEVIWNADNLDLTEMSSSSSDRDLNWLVSDSEIASISSSGILDLHKPGTVTIIASLLANDDWNAPENVEQVLTVIKADQEITFNPLPTKAEGDQSFSLNSYASSSSNLQLDFESSNSNVVSIANGVVTIEGSGTAIITASQSGNDYYNAAGDVEQSIGVSESVYIWEDGLWTFGETVYSSFQPTKEDNVEIRDNYAFSIQGAFAAKNLTITSSGSISVNNEGALEVTESLINNGGLTIQSGSSLITYEGQAVSDNIIIKRNTRYADGRYSFVGTPVEFDLSIIGSDLGLHVYAYDEAAAEATDDLVRWIDASSNALNPGQGYTQSNQQLIEFTGTPNTGTITYPGSFDNDGWHMVSNPYPAALFIDDFLDANTNTTDAIYIWDDNGSNTGRGSNSDYIVANKSGATDNGGVDNEARWNGRIGAMQGFFVQLDGSAGDITFTEGMRVSGNNSDDNFFRTSFNQSPIMRVNLTHAEGLSRQAVIAWNEQISNDQLAEGYDARVYSEESQYMIYTKKANTSLAIQTINSSTEIVPLGYKVEEAGSYSINVDLDESQGYELLLRDKDLDQVVDASSGYEFVTSEGQFNDRFELIKNFGVLGLTDQDVEVYAYEQTIYINLPSGMKRTIDLINLNGQKVLTKTINQSIQIQTNLPAGVYLITDGERTHKIILK
ncbi:MAG: hypothetical protein CMP48_05645 [Rickettsiales bacterium]|nr:hypothetical protein [Rickettsiales bacterium]